MTDTAQKYQRMIGECARTFVDLAGGYDQLAALGSVEELWDNHTSLLERVVLGIELDDLRGMSDLGPTESIDELIQRAPKKDDPLAVNQFFAKVAIARTVFKEASGPSHKKTVTGMAAPGWADRRPIAPPKPLQPMDPAAAAAPTPTPDVTAPQQPRRAPRSDLPYNDAGPVVVEYDPNIRGPITQYMDAATPPERSRARRRIGKWVGALILCVIALIIVIEGGGKLVVMIIRAVRGY